MSYFEKGNKMSTDKHIEDQTARVPVEIEVEGKKGSLDFNTLKSGGIIKQRQKDLFTVRLQCPGGRVPLDRLEKAFEVARRYGGDYVHLSFRQSLEIPYVNYRDLGNVRDELAKAGQHIASCGARVRVPTACSGCEYNPNGLTDTQAMAREISDRFFGKGSLAHKFKISFSGCPIDCARTNEMELGFQGAVEPRWEESACQACGVCIEACREQALVCDEQSGHPRYIPEGCLYCGDCIRTCPFDAWHAKRVGWIVRCGGKHGRHPVNGQIIARFLPDERVAPLIGAALKWYEQFGENRGRVRLGDFLKDKETWRDFLRHIRHELGDWAAKNPPPPQPNEIHFPQRQD
ncbi:MAG: sulfite reductase [Candidatus Abyssobacteria bacterium SURF_5]|uniref:Sulfite reductase n=1 Tax=Abyssobacteria bacterium (strain SURF_5) TaxID=2093360 RepID=A0A3A4P0H5_ABYX5|nr:MAG: sulfite reductase [Candidatus Abyssubacteria bacterium SURF_5]